jgi:hypothetical protein
MSQQGQIPPALTHKNKQSAFMKLSNDKIRRIARSFKAGKYKELSFKYPEERK